MDMKVKEGGGEELSTGEKGRGRTRGKRGGERMLIEVNDGYREGMKKER
jgi:hypothetical protein